MKLFSYDSKFMGFLSSMVDVIWLNILWTICGLPVITMGASTIAAYTVTLKMVEGTEGRITKQFFKAFVSNLKHGTIHTIIMAVLLYSAYLSNQIFWNTESNPVIYIIIVVLLVFVLLWHYIYVFPIEARYSNTIMNNLNNARKLFMGYIFRTVATIILLGIEFLLLFYYGFANSNTFSTILVVLGVLIGPVCMMMTVSGMVMPIFRQLDHDAAVARGEIPEEEREEFSNEYDTNVREGIYSDDHEDYILLVDEDNENTNQEDMQ